MAYSIELTKAAAKQLKALEKQPRERLVALLQELAEDPRPFGALKLEGVGEAYRARTGDFRAIYEIDDATKSVTVTWVGDRKDAYK